MIENIFKVSIDEGLNIVVYEDNVLVDGGHTVRDIIIQDNFVYVLSNRKVSVLLTTFFSSPEHIVLKGSF